MVSSGTSGSAHAPRFTNGQYFARCKGKDNWYCTLCTLPHRAEFERMTGPEAILHERSSHKHATKLREYESWNWQPDHSGWEDPTPVLTDLRTWERQGWVDRLSAFIPYWQEGVLAAESGREVESMESFLDRIESAESSDPWGENPWGAADIGKDLWGGKAAAPRGSAGSGSGSTGKRSVERAQAAAPDAWGVQVVDDAWDAQVVDNAWGVQVVDNAWGVQVVDNAWGVPAVEDEWNTQNSSRARPNRGGGPGGKSKWRGKQGGQRNAKGNPRTPNEDTSRRQPGPPPQRRGYAAVVQGA